MASLPGRSRGLQVKYYALREPSLLLACVEKGSSRRFYEPGGTRVQFEGWAEEEFGARFEEVTEDEARELVYGERGKAGGDRESREDSLAAELEANAGRPARVPLQNLAASLAGIAVFLGLLYLAQTLSGVSLDEWSIASVARVFVITIAGPLLAGSFVFALSCHPGSHARLSCGLVFAVVVLWVNMILDWVGVSMYDDRLRWIDHVGAIAKMFFLFICARIFLARRTTNHSLGPFLGLGIAFALLCVDIVRGWFVSWGPDELSGHIDAAAIWASLLWVASVCVVSLAGAAAATGVRSAIRRVRSAGIS